MRWLLIVLILLAGCSTPEPRMLSPEAAVPEAAAIDVVTRFQASQPATFGYLVQNWLDLVGTVRVRVPSRGLVRGILDNGDLDRSGRVDYNDFNLISENYRVKKDN